MLWGDRGKEGSRRDGNVEDPAQYDKNADETLTPKTRKSLTADGF